MLEPTNELSPRNYSREDESARRLWLTQRTKANPWEGRRPPDEEEERPDSEDGEVPAAAPVPQPAVISQTDALRLERSSEGPADPFAALIIRRMNP
ncbi:MAG: hypothetical protein VKQ33_06525 [Candidatus Sericytochromatia bacterium]|nr:hypothetical protein [Candidatus Sericytochromatia bacterium]